MSDINTKLEAAKNWLGSRWLLAEPVRPRRTTSHVRVPVDRWHAMNHAIASTLEGALHV